MSKTLTYLVVVSLLLRVGELGPLARRQLRDVGLLEVLLVIVVLIVESGITALVPSFYPTQISRAPRHETHIKQAYRLALGGAALVLLFVPLHGLLLDLTVGCMCMCMYMCVCLDYDRGLGRQSQSDLG